MDRGGIEPPTFALRTRHYTTKPPAPIVFLICIFIYFLKSNPQTTNSNNEKSDFLFKKYVENEQTFSYIVQTYVLIHESTHSR